MSTSLTVSGSAAPYIPPGGAPALTDYGPRRLTGTEHKSDKPEGKYDQSPVSPTHAAIAAAGAPMAGAARPFSVTPLITQSPSGSPGSAATGTRRRRLPVHGRPASTDGIVPSTYCGTAALTRSQNGSAHHSQQNSLDLTSPVFGAAMAATLANASDSRAAAGSPVTLTPTPTPPHSGTPTASMPPLALSQRAASAAFPSAAIEVGAIAPLPQPEQAPPNAQVDFDPFPPRILDNIRTIATKLIKYNHDEGILNKYELIENIIGAGGLCTGAVDVYMPQFSLPWQAYVVGGVAWLVAKIAVKKIYSPDSAHSPSQSTEKHQAQITALTEHYRNRVISLIDNAVKLTRVGTYSPKTRVDLLKNSSPQNSKAPENKVVEQNEQKLNFSNLSAYKQQKERLITSALGIARIAAQCTVWTTEKDEQGKLLVSTFDRDKVMAPLHTFTAIFTNEKIDSRLFDEDTLQYYNDRCPNDKEKLLAFQVEATMKSVMADMGLTEDVREELKQAAIKNAKQQLELLTLNTQGAANATTLTTLTKNIESLAREMASLADQLKARQQATATAVQTALAGLSQSLRQQVSDPVAASAVSKRELPQPLSPVSGSSETPVTVSAAAAAAASESPPSLSPVSLSPAPSFVSAASGAGVANHSASPLTLNERTTLSAVSPSPRSPSERSGSPAASGVSYIHPPYTRSLKPSWRFSPQKMVEVPRTPIRPRTTPKPHVSPFDGSLDRSIKALRAMSTPTSLKRSPYSK